MIIFPFADADPISSEKAGFGCHAMSLVAKERFVLTERTLRFREFPVNDVKSRSRMRRISFPATTTCVSSGDREMDDALVPSAKVCMIKTFVNEL